MNARTLSHCFVAAFAAALVGCTGSEVTAPAGRETANFFEFPRDDDTPNLIQCPAGESSTGSAVITPLGGLLSVAGASILIPAGALLSDALVTIRVPVSNYVEVDISVEGSEHFIFERPVIVTMSYARCSRSDLGAWPLSVWYIDGAKQPLEEMPSFDNRLLKTITFTTGHLSGYAVAN